MDLLETPNTDNLAVAEVENVDEAITAEAKSRNEMKINIKYEQRTKSYEETINIDTENINTIENRKKVYTKNGGLSTKLYNQIF